MDGVALGLPCLARCREHGGFAGTGETDHGRDPPRPGDMLDRPALLVRQPGGRIAGAALKDGVLPLDRTGDMPAIDAMTMRLVHPLRALDHAGFDLDHFPRRIARKLDLAGCRVDLLRLKLHQRRRGHHLRKGILERLRIVVDITMQRPRHVAPIEHALFARDERQNLFRLFTDEIGVPPHRILVQPRARHIEPAPLHLRGMDAHMLGRRDL